MARPARAPAAALNLSAAGGIESCTMSATCLPMPLAMIDVPRSEPEDAELVRRAAAGDARAFESIYRRHAGRVHGAVWRLSGMNPVRAEELTQEAFVRAWQKLGSFRFESAFTTWLHRLAVNVALMDLRSRAPEDSVEDEVLDSLGAERPAPAPRARRHRWLPLAAAAMIAAVTTAGLSAVVVQHHAAEAPLPVQASLSAGEQIERARTLARSAHPDLAGAEVVLDSASSELEQALQQQPDAVFLVGLINRTHAQRRKLARLGLHAG